jgi:hypothetical protein
MYEGLHLDNRDEERNRSVEELRTIAQSRYRYAEDNKDDPKRQETLEAAIQWGKKHPQYLKDLFLFAVGESSSRLWGSSLGNPVLIEALGHFSDPRIIEMIKKRLEKRAKGEMQFFTKDLISALLLMDGDKPIKAMSSLLKKPKKNKILFDFLWALEDNPKIEYLDIILSIIEKAGWVYKGIFILSAMAESNRVPFEKLLAHRSKNVRRAALETLNVVPEQFLTERILNQIQVIVDKPREDLMVRSYAADVLKRSGRQVPLCFRDRLLHNESDDLKRLVHGVLFPSNRPDDWALTESVPRRYEGDGFRVNISTLPLGQMHADVWVWRRCFWDQYVMGVWLRKERWPSTKYRIVGVCRSRDFLSKSFTLSCIEERLDWILIGLVDGFTNSAGAEYERTIRYMNRLIASNEVEHAENLSALMRFWHLDPSKINEQGGCPS